MGIDKGWNRPPAGAAPTIINVPNIVTFCIREISLLGDIRGAFSSRR